MSHDPYFHAASASVRFWVPAGETGIDAIISKETLSYGFRGRMTDEDPLAIYASHLKPIHEAVLRRIEAGARQPVILREHHLSLPSLQ
jgi:Protein of unknown function (DUF1488)